MQHIDVVIIITLQFCYVLLHVFVLDSSYQQHKYQCTVFPVAEHSQIVQCSKWLAKHILCIVDVILIPWSG